MWGILLGTFLVAVSGTLAIFTNWKYLMAHVNAAAWQPFLYVFILIFIFVLGCGIVLRNA